MGMNTRGGGGSSNKTYLGVYANQLVLEYAKEEDLVAKLEALGYDPDKIQERKKTKGKNEGQSVYYFVVWDVEGMLTGISINETDWGDFVELEFTDVDEKFVISLGDVFSRMSKDFIRRMENLDLGSEINFGLWSMTTDDGKNRSGVKMYQDDTKVEYALTFDDMPEPTQTKKGRTVTWNYDEQEAFLYEELNKYLADNFKGSSSDDEDGSGKTPLDSATPKKRATAPTADEKPSTRAKQPRKPRGKVAEPAEEAEDDDLPF
tara:strand:+ start:2734 stop:3519 length:786 start_codon:yes stop_codon:yes gene_type:complete